MRYYSFLLAAACLGPAAAAAADRHTSEQGLSAKKFKIRGQSPCKRGNCNADDCARAVTGTAQGLTTQSAHLSDCSSFYAVTVTPAASTSTVTVTPATSIETIATTFTETDTSTIFITTVTAITDVESYTMQKRFATTSAPGASTVCASMVPSYASACSGTSRYSSACSCAGVTYHTSYATASTTYVTVTAATPVLTDEIAATTTVEATTTALVGYTYDDEIKCGQTVDGPDDGFPITVVCEAQPSSPGSVVSQYTAADWDACLKSADESFECTSFEYVIATKQCTLYHDSTPAYSYSPATGMVFGHFNNG